MSLLLDTRAAEAAMQQARDNYYNARTGLLNSALNEHHNQAKPLHLVIRELPKQEVRAAESAIPILIQIHVDCGFRDALTIAKHINDEYLTRIRTISTSITRENTTLLTLAKKAADFEFRTEISRLGNSLPALALIELARPRASLQTLFLRSHPLIVAFILLSLALSLALNLREVWLLVTG